MAAYLTVLFVVASEGLTNAFNDGVTIPRSLGRMPHRQAKEICGSDFQIYKNECAFISRRCHLNKTLVQIPMVHCKQKTLPENIEQLDDAPDDRPMCGSNGNTYDGPGSRCEFLLDQCDDEEILFAHPGRCGNCSVENICPNQDGTKELKKKICGSDGNMYENTCELFKINCQLVSERKQAIKISKTRSTCAAYNFAEL